MLYETVYTHNHSGAVFNGLLSLCFQSILPSGQSEAPVLLPDQRGQLHPDVKSNMTQEGQALPSPTPSENPAEPSLSTSDLPAEALNQTGQDKPGTEVKQDIEWRKEDGSSQGSVGTQREEHCNVEGRAKIKKEGGEEDLKASAVVHDQPTDEGEGEKRDAASGDECRNDEGSSTREKERHAEDEMREDKEEGKGEEMQPQTEDGATRPQQDGRLVSYS